MAIQQAVLWREKANGLDRPCAQIVSHTQMYAMVVPVHVPSEAVTPLTCRVCPLEYSMTQHFYITGNTVFVSVEILKIVPKLSRSVCAPAVSSVFVNGANLVESAR